MDDWLDEVGLYRKNTALDGSCLFRAVAQQIMSANPITGHLILRKQCCQFMKANRSLYEDKVCADFDDYMEALAMAKGYGTVLELDAISRLYCVEFLVFFGPEKPLRVTKNGYSKELMLCVTSASFYDAVYKKSHVQNLGFCQSIVYKILYEDVFKLDDLEYAVNHMLHDKAARAQRERFLSNQVGVARDDYFDSYLQEDGDSTVKVRKVLDSGAILFPYKVAKALDPDIYRNIDFDNWVESQRVTRRNNLWYGSGGPLRVGVKCQVRFEGQTLTGHVQDLAADHGPAVVFIEELSQKMKVPFADLIALPRSSVKPEWSYSHKHQMINKFVRSNREGSPDTNRFPWRRGYDVSTSERQEDTYSQASTVAEADSTVNSPKSSPPLGKITMHSLIRTPDDIWTCVDKYATVSINDDYGDLPFDDLPTLRFFYNMGIEYFNRGVLFAKPLNLDQPEDSFIATGENSAMVEACQGAPLMHPPPLPSAVMEPMAHPPPPLLLDPIPALMVGPPPPMLGGPLPPVTVCSPPTMIASPMMLGPIVSPVAIPSPPCASPPRDPPSPDSSTPVRSQEPSSLREGKNRGRSHQFTKPPRFQRLESARAAQREIHNEVQSSEISSCAEESLQMSVAFDVEPYPYLDFGNSVLEPQPIFVDTDGNYMYYPAPIPFYYQ